MIEKISSNQVQQVERNKTTGNGFENQFDECLTKAMDESQGTGVVAGGSEPLSITPLHEIMFGQTGDELVPMEKTLDLMEQLSAALSDPGTTTKSLDPIIQNLDRQAQELLAGAGDLPQGDRARSLMEETAATAMVQVTKFERGDFS